MAAVPSDKDRKRQDEENLTAGVVHVEELSLGSNRALDVLIRSFSPPIRNSRPTRSLFTRTSFLISVLRFGGVAADTLFQLLIQLTYLFSLALKVGGVHRHADIAGEVSRRFIGKNDSSTPRSRKTLR